MPPDCNQAAERHLTWLLSMRIHPPSTSALLPEQLILNIEPDAVSCSATAPPPVALLSSMYVAETLNVLLSRA
jgi:hypothetical protein